jgi:hypothetical protein
VERGSLRERVVPGRRSHVGSYASVGSYRHAKVQDVEWDGASAWDFSLARQAAGGSVTSRTREKFATEVVDTVRGSIRRAGVAVGAVATWLNQANTSPYGSGDYGSYDGRGSTRNSVPYPASGSISGRSAPSSNTRRGGNYRRYNARGSVPSGISCPVAGSITGRSALQKYKHTHISASSLPLQVARCGLYLWSAQSQLTISHS